MQQPISHHLPLRRLLQINIILPLSGRIDTFRGFMDKLGSLILRHDRRLFLTVVYFGHEGLQEVRNIITSASKEAKFRHIKLLTLNETFSRGKALQVGQFVFRGVIKGRNKTFISFLYFNICWNSLESMC